jgi:hypothetical protein
LEDVIPLVSYSGHRAHTTSRNHEMRGKTTVSVVAWHDLAGADHRSPRQAGGATLTRDYRRDHNRLIQQVLATRRCGADNSADLMSQDEREFITGLHTVIKEPQVCVADTAAGNFYEQLSV